MFDDLIQEVAGRSAVSKLGEGSFKEVFKCRDRVIAVMPIEGTTEINDEPPPTAEAVLGELLVSQSVAQLTQPSPSSSDPNGAAPALFGSHTAGI